ncbi:hypothetical protein GALL_153080 [mine drainage metagenome]|uniref:Sulfatase-modifying factor enzyme domain-containing protein n=1 Tax=mine drainage metagenome TaxID=410659 RepID=A0A1J5S3D0_9ZZZZ
MNAPERIAAITQDQFVTVPETILPGGLVVPAFQIGKYLTSKGADGRAVITEDGAPWVSISYREARKAAELAGYQLITESQYLAAAYQAAVQGENWTGGNVGRDLLYQGLRKWSVSSAQPATFNPKDPDERRWFALPGGELVFDLAGNAYSWVFDDIQGDSNGLVAKPIASDSPSIVIPYPPVSKGQGWTPKGGTNWSGDALIRGGYWGSGAFAGVFILNLGGPGGRGDGIGFRCTK